MLFHPGAEAQHVKTFEFNVSGSKNIKFKGFKLPDHVLGCLNAKSFDLGLSRGLRFQKNLNSILTGAWRLDLKTIRSEAFNILESRQQ